MSLWIQENLVHVHPIGMLLGAKPAVQLVDDVPAFCWVSIFVRAGTELARLSHHPGPFLSCSFVRWSKKKEVSCEGQGSCGHHLKIKGPRDKGALAQRCFTQRGINIWNRLTSEVAEAAL